MNNNPMMMMFMNLMNQAKANPQAFVNNLLQNNPQFAQMLQGQNPQNLAMQELQKRGIDPQQFLGIINGNGRK